MKTTGFVALRYREYRLFWIAAAFSNIGMWALVSGRLWLMRGLTDSELMLGLVPAASLGPVLALSMWGGVVADRVDRLRLVMVTRGMFAALAFLTGTLIATGVIRPWHVLAISFGTGVLLSFDIPSRQAIMPGLVRREHLPGAIALYGAVTSGAAVFGPMFFAPLVDLSGMQGVFFLIGSAYALTVVVLGMMKPLGRRLAAGRNRLWQDLLGGFGYVRGHRVILSLVALGVIVGLFGSSYRTLLPVFADTVLEGGVGSYSLLLLGAGAGGMAGTMLLTWFGNVVRPVYVQVASGAGFGLALVAFSHMSWLPASVAAVGALGMFAVLLGTTNNTLVQTLVAEEFRGRVMSIHQITWGVSALGGLMMGAMAQAVSAQFALTLGGAVTAAATVTIALLALRPLLVGSQTESRRASPIGPG